ncbi:MAG: excinuclease ABC subunit UvrC, partial [Propionibacteriaceae bacterium]|nr:excinuclease ABC subunit UvrC [Propionibacteriaceae bacterium]
ERNAIVLGDGANADVIALADEPLEVAFQIFHVREGRVAGERGWVADRTDDTDTAGLVEAFLLQLYGSDSAVPDEVLVQVAPDGTEALTQWLTGLRGAKVSLRVPQRGDKRVLMDTVARNAAQTLAQHKLKRSTDLTRRNQALEELQEALGLADAPLRIECYDISHIQGTNVVGSMVVFEDGLARKSEYRRFIIKSVEGSDDEAAMDEVLTRRFKRLLDDESELAAAEDLTSMLVDPDTGVAKRFAYRPALVVVDGGLPQVSAAQRCFDRLGLMDVALVGLAKRLEEVWLPGVAYPVILPRASEGLYLLQRIRDEAHRFAIAFHRERRGKAMVQSVLDGVPGLGEVRRATVRKAFPSLKKLRAATVDDLAELPGIGPSTAEAIIAALIRDVPGMATNTATGEIVE